MISELEDALNGPSNLIYLCCVNRGILDDALTLALETGDAASARLLETIAASVSLSPTSPSCWPLAHFEEVAVWPMDVESLLVSPDSGGEAAARSLLEQAVSPEKWQRHGECAAGPHCPFCTSRDQLSKESSREALIRILRWHEISTSRRWSFRDLFSLTSYLLAGHRNTESGDNTDPCEWAAVQLGLDGELSQLSKPSKTKSVALFELLAASYEHALFGEWRHTNRAQFRQDIRDLSMETNHTLMGLFYFLQSRRSTAHYPATIAASLESMSHLDPALADPDGDIPVSSKSNLTIRDIDIAFSQSVEAGFDLVRKYQFLNATEAMVLRRLGDLDKALSGSATRRKKPAAALRVQATIRDFACRVVRRSLGAKSAVVPNESILRAYQQIGDEKEGQGRLLYDAARRVEELLNTGDAFEVSLTTTFGQPIPPEQRRATLVLPRRAVRMTPQELNGRPKSPIRFLRVGSGSSEQSIALTYDLFKAVIELDRGLSRASLPKTVVAMLDAAKARLSGPLVRDAELLERARMRLGDSRASIMAYRDTFVARAEDRSSGY
ncbi:MAG: hypothetical protein ABL879_01430 [Devosia sp.]